MIATCLSLLPLKLLALLRSLLYSLALWMVGEAGVGLLDLFLPARRGESGGIGDFCLLVVEVPVTSGLGLCGKYGEVGRLPLWPLFCLALLASLFRVGGVIGGEGSSLISENGQNPCYVVK